MENKEVIIVKKLQLIKRKQVLYFIKNHFRLISVKCVTEKSNEIMFIER